MQPAVIRELDIPKWTEPKQVGVLVREVWRGLSARALMTGEPPAADKGLTRKINGLTLTRSAWCLCKCTTPVVVTHLQCLPNLKKQPAMTMRRSPRAASTLQVGRRTASRRRQLGAADI